MIRTKISLIVFTVLLFSLFPFSILFIRSDFVSSIIPGWNTTINGFSLIATLLKFIILLIVVFTYWKLNKIVKEIEMNFFVLHLTLTIPSVFNSKIPLQSFIEFDGNTTSKAISQLEAINLIVIILNILFVIGQVIFGIYYIKKRNHWKGNK